MSEDETEPREALNPEAVNAADPASQAKARKRASRRAEEDREFWRKTLADPIGRRVIWDMLDQAHTFAERFACGPNGFPQPEATWFEAGVQSFGMRLFKSLLRLNRDGVLTMMDEHDPAFAEQDKR